jgi:hypothetical protein
VEEKEEKGGRVTKARIEIYQQYHPTVQKVFMPMLSARQGETGQGEREHNTSAVLLNLPGTVPSPQSLLYEVFISNDVY